tara:strand:+ start:2340 stop:3218 length:879 start_codon:yes stop_codon:yes gene_type:complete
MRGIFASIARLFERNPQFSGPLAELSQDPVALAEILVLFRMVLADGIVQPSQLRAFERICAEHFAVAPQDMPELHALLDSPKARACEAEAFTLLRQLDTEARTTLLGGMMRIANANGSRDELDDRMIRRTAALLGLEPAIAIVEKEQGMTETPHDPAPPQASLGDRVRGFLDRYSSMNRVAHDPMLTAELLLLVRMSFADKTVEAAEADAFAAICTRLLGLNGDELTDILKYLHDFGYETTDAQAADMLAGLDEARKREILDHLALVAKADGEVTDRERRLLEATARRLGFD